MSVFQDRFKNIFESGIGHGKLQLLGTKQRTETVNA
jgi:hypothetical protein